MRHNFDGNMTAVTAALQPQRVLDRAIPDHLLSRTVLVVYR